MTTLTLPVWPPASDVAFFAAAKAVFDEFRGYGLPIAGSLGMVAQGEAESAFKISIPGDDGSAHGIFQWHTQRIAQIKAGTGIDITTAPPIADQCAAAWWELQTFPSLGLTQLRASTTAMQAGIAGCQFLERAGAKDAAQRRGAMAERWAAYAANNGWTP
jgi:hypothetical protein